MRQKVEIDVDVPDGWRIKCQGTRNNIRPAIGPSSFETQVVANIIIEKVEPKRESRWKNLYEVEEEGYGSREGADKASHIETRQGCIRLDYEDGNLVAVTLEPEGEEA